MNKILIIGTGIIACLVYILLFVPATKQDNTVLRKLAIDDKVTISVETATNMVEQERGLSYRKELPANQGMLFVFSQPSIPAFWMKDMNFPLDFLWIDANNVIVDMHQNVPQPHPNTPLNQLPVVRPAKEVTKVLEVNAGFVNRYHITIGDTVQYQEN